jgi:hypothetical protein
MSTHIQDRKGMRYSKTKPIAKNSTKKEATRIMTTTARPENNDFNGGDKQ